jgi:hypothetical protein
MSGDFLPGYVTTMSNSLFPVDTKSIIVMGFEDGKVGGVYDTKEAFFKRLSDRKKRSKLAVYVPNNFILEEHEKEHMWNKNAWFFDAMALKRVRDSFKEMMQIVYH